MINIKVGLAALAMSALRPSTPCDAVLVPDAPELATEVIDVRDLAAWLNDAGSRQLGGVNATGDMTALFDHFETARRVVGHTRPVVLAAP